MALGLAGNALVAGGSGGGGGAPFDPPSGTAALVDTDGLVVDDGGSLQTRTKRFMEASLEPIHIKPLVTEDGYLYSTTSVQAGSVRLFDTSGNTIIGLVPKANFEQEIDEIMQPGFIVRIQNAANTVYREGIITGQSTQGSFRLGTLSSHGLLSAGTFSNDDAITFTAKGRHPLWSDFATSTEIAAGTEGRKFLTPANMASQDAAQRGTDGGAVASALSIRQHVGIESAEQTWSGFQTTTDATPGLGTWSMSSASSPFVRTFKYRPHTLAEHDAIMLKAVGGAYIQQFEDETKFRQYYAPSITSAAVANSDVPLITALAVVEFGFGDFTASTDSSLTILGAVRSLSARTHDFKSVAGNNQVTMDQTFRNFPRRAGTTEYTEDWEMNVYCTSMTSVINTDMMGVTAWNTSSSSPEKKCNARVQWSTDGGSTWENSPEFTNIYHSNIAANLPVVCTYQIRPGFVGPVKVRWQVRRTNNQVFFFEISQARASVA